jgi:hypothetical protein
MERYEEQAGRYVLYVGGMRVSATESVALLVDAERGRLVSVRRELDALRAIDPERTAGWLLLEGRPALAALNRALRGNMNIHELHLAFTQASAERLAGELIARLRQRRMT